MLGPLRGAGRGLAVDVRERRALAARAARPGPAGAARSEDQVARGVHRRAACRRRALGARPAGRRAHGEPRATRADARRSPSTARATKSPQWRAHVRRRSCRRESVAAVNAVDRKGRIIASTMPEICGPQAQPRIMAPQLAQVFAGRTQFIRPFAADPRLVAAQPFLGARPLAWVETPVRDAAGNVVAALGIATYVDRDFESILSAARPGETGEAYAFDETGTLLSEIRDVRGLQRRGHAARRRRERAAFASQGARSGPRARRVDATRRPARPNGRSRGRSPRALTAAARPTATVPLAGRAARSLPQLSRRRSHRRVALAAGRAHGHRRRDRRSTRRMRRFATCARRWRVVLDAARAHRGLGRMVHARARPRSPQGPRRVGASARTGSKASSRKAAWPRCISRITRSSSVRRRSRS